MNNKTISYAFGYYGLVFYVDKLCVEASEANSCADKERMHESLLFRIQFLAFYADVAQAVGYPEFAKLLEELSARLYNPQAAQWNAQAFMNCFDKVVSKKYSSTKGSGKPLPDLYD